MRNALVILAGGSGKRFKSQNIPKQFLKIDNLNLIEYFLNYLDTNIFDIIQIVVKKKFETKYLNNLRKRFPNHKINFVKSGNTRQESSKFGLNSLKKYNPKNVLIHDAARPYVTNILISKLLENLKNNRSCIPYINYNDFKRYKSEKYEIKNSEIMNIQTPQAFIYKDILETHNLSKKKNFKDDSSLFESVHKKIRYIKGEKTNLKITFKDDVNLFRKYKYKENRSGIGYDIHKINFKSKKKLILCGVRINHLPLIGHSDADVGYHAICDSILGALSKKDIGNFFKNDDMKWKNANSKIFMNFCKKLLEKNNYFINNLDINFICETPNINRYVEKMKINISKILCIKKNIISIKATTNEKISFIGKGEGIAAESIIQIQNV